MNVIIITGPPASGKMTVGRELSTLISYPLFYNHMSIELVVPFFDFGTPAFSRLNRKIRFEIFNEFIIYLSSVIHLNFMFESSPAMTDDMLALKNKIGWVQIGVVSSNVLVNLTMVGKSTLGELKDQIIEFVNSFDDRKREKLEAKAREKILGELEGNVVEYIKMKEEEQEALEFCKDYHP